MPTLQNLPPKAREKIDNWLKQYDGYTLEYEGAIHFILKTKSLPEPAVIGLLTAWLESEGWEYSWNSLTKTIIFYKCKVKVYSISVKNSPFYLLFLQAFEKVTKIMEEQG